MQVAVSDPFQCFIVLRLLLSAHQTGKTEMLGWKARLNGIVVLGMQLTQLQQYVVAVRERGPRYLSPSHSPRKKGQISSSRLHQRSNTSSSFHISLKQVKIRLNCIRLILFMSLVSCFFRRDIPGSVCGGPLQLHVFVCSCICSRSMCPLHIF